MDFELTESQEAIRRAVAELSARFDDDYWLDKDSRHEFPWEFYTAFAEAGWLGPVAAARDFALTWNGCPSADALPNVPVPAGR